MDIIKHIERTIITFKPDFLELISAFESFLNTLLFHIEGDEFSFPLRSYPLEHDYFLVINVSRRDKKGRKLIYRYEFAKNVPAFQNDNLSFFKFLASFGMDYTRFVPVFTDLLKDILTSFKGSIEPIRRKTVLDEASHFKTLVLSSLKSLERAITTSLRETGKFTLPRDLNRIFHDIDSLDDLPLSVSFKDQQVLHIILELEDNKGNSLRELIQLGDNLSESVFLRNVYHDIHALKKEGRPLYFVNDLKNTGKNSTEIILKRYSPPFYDKVYAQYGDTLTLLVDDKKRFIIKGIPHRLKQITLPLIEEVEGFLYEYQVREDQTTFRQTFKESFFSLHNAYKRMDIETQLEIPLEDKRRLARSFLMRDVGFPKFKLASLSGIEQHFRATRQTSWVDKVDITKIEYFSAPQLCLIFTAYIHPSVRMKELFNPLPFKYVLLLNPLMGKLREKLWIKTPVLRSLKDMSDEADFTSINRYGHFEPSYLPLEDRNFYLRPTDKTIVDLDLSEFELLELWEEGVMREFFIYITGFSPLKRIYPLLKVCPYTLTIFDNPYIDNPLIKVERFETSGQRIPFSYNDRVILFTLIRTLTKTANMGGVLKRSNHDVLTNYDLEVESLALLLKKEARDSMSDYLSQDGKKLRELLELHYKGYKEFDDISHEIYNAFKKKFTDYLLDSEVGDAHKEKLFKEVTLYLQEVGDYEREIFVDYSYAPVKSPSERLVIDYILGHKYFTVSLQTPSQKRADLMKGIESSVSLDTIDDFLKTFTERLYQFDVRKNEITTFADPVILVLYTHEDEGTAVKREVVLEVGNTLNKCFAEVIAFADEQMIADESLADQALNDIDIIESEELIKDILIVINYPEPHDLRGIKDCLVNTKTLSKTFSVGSNVLLHQIVDIRVREEGRHLLSPADFYEDLEEVFVKLEGGAPFDEFIRLSTGDPIDDIFTITTTVSTIKINSDNKICLIRAEGVRLRLEEGKPVTLNEKDLDLTCERIATTDPSKSLEKELVLMIFFWESDDSYEEYQIEIEVNAKNPSLSPLQTETIDKVEVSSDLSSVTINGTLFEVGEAYDLYMEEDGKYDTYIDQVTLDDIYPDQRRIEDEITHQITEEEVNLRRVKFSVSHRAQDLGNDKSSILEAWRKIKTEIVEEEVDPIEIEEEKELVSFYTQTDRETFEKILEALSMIEALNFFLDENDDLITWEFLAESSREFLEDNQVAILGEAKRLREEIEKVIEVKPEPPKPPAVEVVPVKEEDIRKELNKLTVKELKQICKDNNVSGYSGLRKGEIIDLIMESLPLEDLAEITGIKPLVPPLEIEEEPEVLEIEEEIEEEIESDLYEIMNALDSPFPHIAVYSIPPRPFTDYESQFLEAIAKRHDIRTTREKGGMKFTFVALKDKKEKSEALLKEIKVFYQDYEDEIRKKSQQ